MMLFVIWETAITVVYTAIFMLFLLANQNGHDGQDRDR